MWEKAAAEPLKREIKQVLRPPQRQKRAHGPNTLLRMQAALCLLMVLVAAALRFLQLPPYGAVRTWYLNQAGQEGTFLQEQELVRFAAELVKNVPQDTGVLSAQAAEIAPTEDAPDGYKTDTLQPEQPTQPPLQPIVVTSGYGWRSDPFTEKAAFHSGVDLSAEQGRRVVPAMAGIVLKADRGREYGNYLELLHGDGLVTLYAHLQYLFARPGETVNTDTVLGTVGATGNATGPHLHLELLKDNIRYDPSRLLV